jgi:hypothetical protein
MRTARARVPERGRQGLRPPAGQVPALLDAEPCELLRSPVSEAAVEHEGDALPVPPERLHAQVGPCRPLSQPGVAAQLADEALGRVEPGSGERFAVARREDTEARDRGVVRVDGHAVGRREDP